MKCPQIRYDVPTRAIFPFLLVAFGLAWGIMAAFILWTDAIVALFGELSASHPLFILAVYAPAIAAFGLVGLHCGADGLKRFLSRLLLWRVPVGFYGLLLIGIPLVYAAGAAVKGTLWGLPFPFSSFGEMLGAMAFMFVLGPMEEFGWRGLAQPILQRRLAPIWAALVLGVIWGVWHLPAFFLSGTPQSAWGFMPFFVGSISVAVILTPMFNLSGGSILLAMLFHFQLNNPLWPDAQPYDTWFFVALAVCVVWLNRGTMFRRYHGVTRVVPEAT